MNDEKTNGLRDSIRHLRQVVTLGALGLALTHLLFPKVAIDAITLALLAIALVPWLAPLFKSLELPGGWKVEFQDFQKVEVRAEAAGLLAPREETPTPAYTFQRIADQDPNLALAGLRIEIERRLVQLAQSRDIPVRSRGLGSLLRDLTRAQVLSDSESSVLADLAGLLNPAVHGALVEPQAAKWALETGPRVLKALDDLAKPRG